MSSRTICLHGGPRGRWFSSRLRTVLLLSNGRHCRLTGSQVADVNNRTGFGYHANESDKSNLHDSWTEEYTYVLALPPAPAAAASRATAAKIDSRCNVDVDDDQTTLGIRETLNKYSDVDSHQSLLREEHRAADASIACTYLIPSSQGHFLAHAIATPFHLFSNGKHRLLSCWSDADSWLQSSRLIVCLFIE